MKRKSDPLSAASIVTSLRYYAAEILALLQAAGHRWHKDDAVTLSAAVAYYLALSIFPMLLLLSSGLGIVLKFTHIGRDAQYQILAIVSEHCSPSLEQQVRAILSHLEDQSIVSGPMGVMTACLAAIGVFYQLERGFDKIWQVQRASSAGAVGIARQIIGRRFGAFLMLCGVGILILAIMTANVALGILKQWMNHLDVPGTVLVTIIDATGTMMLNTLAFSAIYRVLPRRKVAWVDALRSGLLVAIIWEVAREFLFSFMIGMRYTTTYGAIGSFIALLLWFYWGVAIMFFGAEYLQVIEQRRREKKADRQMPGGGSLNVVTATAETTQHSKMRAA
ncbi:MAG: YihY/virulence factor BrkB family protein [bacterium]|nr:YihY/virulence factor BrkB family protein [bacterium]